MASTAGVVDAQVLERGVLEVPSATVEMRSAALLMSGQQGGDLDLAVRWFPLDVEGAGNVGGMRDVRVVVEVAGASVLDSGAPLEIFVYAVGPSLDVRAAAALRIDEPAVYESQLLDAGVRAIVTLRLEPGAQELRVLARAGDRFGLRKLAMEIAGRDGSRKPKPPSFTDASGRWLVAWPRERPPEDADALAAAQPQALPVLTAGGSVELSSAAPEDIRARLRRAGAPSSEPEGHSLAVTSGTAQIPAGLAPGVWELTLERGDTASRPVTVWLARAELSESGGAIPWPALVRRSAGDFAAFEPQAHAVTSVELPEDLMRHLDAVLDGYFEALALRAAGDTRGSAHRLAELEAGAIDQLGDGGLELLLAQEDRGFQQLARRLGEVAPLLAVIRLHLEAAEVHREQGRYRLAGLSVGTARRFADAYAKAANDDGRGDVAAVLTALAGVLQVRGPLADAVGVYRQALELQPDDEMALFGLGSVLARVGEARESAATFGRLLEIAPRHDEARLRRAVMLQRLGELSAAGAEYQHLSSSDAGDWIVSLARQQLIRLDLDAGRLDEAGRRIDAALERWPHQVPFHAARARLADLRGDSAAAYEAMLTLDPTESGSESAAGSPVVAGGRTRFHEAPPPDMAALRRRLAEMEASRRAAFAAGLDEILRRRDLPPVAAEVEESRSEGAAGGSR